MRTKVLSNRRYGTAGQTPKKIATIQREVRHEKVLDFGLCKSRLGKDALNQ